MSLRISWLKSTSSSKMVKAPKTGNRFRYKLLKNIHVSLVIGRLLKSGKLHQNASNASQGERHRPLHISSMRRDDRILIGSWQISVYHTSPTRRIVINPSFGQGEVLLAVKHGISEEFQSLIIYIHEGQGTLGLLDEFSIGVKSEEFFLAVGLVDKGILV